MRKGFLITVACAAAATLAGLACGGGEAPSGQTPDSTVTPWSTPLSPRDSTIVPPLEGPERTYRPSERVNYRELPQFQLPDPAGLPTPSGGDPEFHPPESPSCPDGWQVLSRVMEGFQVCYPGDWVIDGHGYVTRGVDDRWYSLGLFRFGQDGRQRAHVSIYLTNPYSQPFMYVTNCERAYQVKLDGQAASLCPDSVGKFPEAKIIAYHVRRGDWDYFINVVPIFEYDSDADRYRDSWSEEDEAMGIRIAQTLQFTEIPPTP